MQNYNILGVHWKIQLLGVGSQKTNIAGGLPKNGDLDSLQIWDGKKEGGGVFEGGWYPNAHYEYNWHTMC